MWNWLTNAGSYIKFLCWVGWHMWEYVYSEPEDPDHSSNHRTCKICGVKQDHSEGKWNITD